MQYIHKQAEGLPLQGNRLKQKAEPVCVPGLTHVMQFLPIISDLALRNLDFVHSRKDF
jgi:hypothetical protein